MKNAKKDDSIFPRILGNPATRCDVKSNKFGHCPEEPSVVFEADNGEFLRVCDKCKQNIIDGAFGPSLQEAFLNTHQKINHEKPNQKN